MNSSETIFENGWRGFHLRLTENEIDATIKLLQKLKTGELIHFHFSEKDWVSEEGGLGNVEFYRCSDDEPSTMYMSA